MEQKVLSDFWEIYDDLLESCYIETLGGYREPKNEECFRSDQHRCAYCLKETIDYLLEDATDEEKELINTLEVENKPEGRGVNIKIKGKIIELIRD